MGDISQPTAADYARSEASEARERNGLLEMRVSMLEKEMQVMVNTISALGKAVTMLMDNKGE